MLFIADAFAQAAPAVTDPNATIGGIPSSIFQIVALVAIFYFLLIRPQMKKSKEQRELVAALQKGDKVVTNSGIIATIAKVEPSDQTFIIEIAPQVKIKILQSFVTSKFNPDAQQAKNTSTKEEKAVENKSSDNEKSEIDNPAAS
ncbi:MAG: preprotein translocase subunit YajC [Alphaproteobacteria bacterium]|nr:preprotein translocase subunit YajC [Alphaproteobacteria bacterium]